LSTEACKTCGQGAMDLLPPNTISETELVIRIREMDCPNFEFIDLPGASFCEQG